jgi:hypothetical protein
MASDWIKMRTDLYRDPKVCVMADLLMQSEGDLGRHVNQNKQRDMCVTRNVMRNATVGALLSVWGVMRMRGKSERSDLICRGVTISVIDDIADMPGFGEAMESVGWVLSMDEGLVFPRFFEDNNVDPEASAKSKSAERQQRFRDRQKENSDANSDVTRNVTRDVTVTHREEKRREEKKDLKPIAPIEKISLDAGGKWQGIPENLATTWNEACPAVDVKAELAKAAAWIIANPKNKKSNYARFLTSWLTRAQDGAKRTGSGPVNGNGQSHDARYVN